MSNSELPPALARAVGGAFYLHGDDLFSKEEAVRALIAVHLAEATRDFNLDRLRGNEVDPEAMASVLARMELRYRPLSLNRGGTIVSSIRL